MTTEQAFEKWLKDEGWPGNGKPYVSAEFAFEAGFEAACLQEAKAEASRYEKAIEVLREVEWSEDDGTECPLCKGWSPHYFEGKEIPGQVKHRVGHKPDCKLAAILKEAGPVAVTPTPLEETKG